MARTVAAAKIDPLRKVNLLKVRDFFFFNDSVQKLNISTLDVFYESGYGFQKSYRLLFFFKSKHVAPILTTLLYKKFFNFSESTNSTSTREGLSGGCFFLYQPM